MANLTFDEFCKVRQECDETKRTEGDAAARATYRSFKRRVDECEKALRVGTEEEFLWRAYLLAELSVEVSKANSDE